MSDWNDFLTENPEDWEASPLLPVGTWIAEIGTIKLHEPTENASARASVPLVPIEPGEDVDADEAAALTESDLEDNVCFYTFWLGKKSEKVRFRDFLKAVGGSGSNIVELAQSVRGARVKIFVNRGTDRDGEPANEVTEITPA